MWIHPPPPGGFEFLAKIPQWTIDLMVTIGALMLYDAIKNIRRN